MTASLFLNQCIKEKKCDLLEVGWGGQWFTEFELLASIHPAEWIVDGLIWEDDGVLAITNFLEIRDAGEPGDDDAWRILWFSEYIFGAVYHEDFDGLFDKSDETPLRYQLSIANLRLYACQREDLGSLPDAILKRCLMDNTLRLPLSVELEWTTRLRDELDWEDSDDDLDILYGRLEEYRLVVPKGTTLGEAFANCTYQHARNFLGDNGTETTQWCIIWLNDEVFWTAMEFSADPLPYRKWIEFEEEDSFICSEFAKDSSTAFSKLAPFLAAKPHCQTPQDLFKVYFDLSGLQSHSTCEHCRILDGMERAWTHIPRQIISRFQMTFQSVRFTAEHIRLVLSSPLVGGIVFLNCSMEDGGIALADTVTKGSQSNPLSLNLEWDESERFLTTVAFESLVRKGILKKQDYPSQISFMVAIAKKNKRSKPSLDSTPHSVRPKTKNKTIYKRLVQRKSQLIESEPKRG